VRFVLDCERDTEGRLTGRLSTVGTDSQPFTGTLELLRLFEDNLPPPDDQTGPGAQRLTHDHDGDPHMSKRV
jgi:hypothetical protein